MSNFHSGPKKQLVFRKITILYVSTCSDVFHIHANLQNGLRKIVWKYKNFENHQFLDMFYAWLNDKEKKTEGKVTQTVNVRLTWLTFWLKRVFSHLKCTDSLKLHWSFSGARIFNFEAMCRAGPKESFSILNMWKDLSLRCLRWL